MGINLFNVMLSAYIKDNLSNLHKKTVYYLTAQDNSVRDDKCILTISQLGLLYNLDNKIFAGNRFDNDLLEFFAKYRSRLSFILINRPNKYYLVRIIITESSLDEREEIDKFMSKNLHKYTKFVRQTTTPISTDEEKVLDINYMRLNSNVTNNKDVTIIFGY